MKVLFIKIIEIKKYMMKDKVKEKYLTMKK